MSPKSATSALGLGFAVAAAAALAQLGLAYGFGLLSWADAAPGSADPLLDYRWNANLAWVAWFSAASCVVGGLASGVIGGRGAASGSPAVRVGAVFAAAVGAFAVGPLVALSAEQNAAASSFPTDPLIASGIGAAVGFVLTLIGLGSRAVAVNVGASVALIWLFAILARFTEIGEPATPASSVIELAVWGSWASPDSMLGRRGFSIAVPFVVGSALIGIVVAAIARRGPITNSGYRIAAASGIAGPLIVTVAHLVADPWRADDPELMAVMLVGPYAAIAGLLGSLIVSAIPRAGGQVDDAPETPETTERIEPAPGWTVPEAPGSAYSDTKAGDTKDLPAEDAPADPDVDWVQELKPVGEGGTLTADADTKTEAKAKPKRPRKTAKRTRRKLADTEPDGEQEES